MIVKKKPVKKPRVSTGWQVPEVFHQHFVPQDRALSSKLGLKPQSKILFFAGFAGNWAEALARNHKVEYSDVSPEVRREAQKRRRDISAFRLADAGALPKRALKYNWSVSFEPWALPTRNFAGALIRSLLNEKGAMLIYRHKHYNTVRAQTIISAIAKVYDCKSSQSRLEIMANTGVGKHFSTAPSLQPFEVFKLLTNAQARKNVLVDSKVFNALKGNLALSAKEAEKVALQKLGLAKNQLKNSLKRLKEMEKAVQEFGPSASIK